MRYKFIIKTSIFPIFRYRNLMKFVFIFTDDDAEITVSVLLDGEETNMDFLDIPFEEVSGLKTIKSPNAK